MDAKNINRSQPDGMDQLLQTLQQVLEQNRLLVEQNRSANERCEKLLEKSQAIEDRWDELELRLIQNLREFYGMLLETLSASIGARNLAWNYVARVIMEKSGFKQEDIAQRYEEEKKSWIEEREYIAEELERELRNMQRPPGEEAFEDNDLGDFDLDFRPKG